MIAKLWHRVAVVLCLFVASCGDDDPAPSDFSAVASDAESLLSEVTGSLIRLDHSSAAAEDLSSWTVKVKALTARATKSQKGSTHTLRRTQWNPALGKFHAASRALIENPETDEKTALAVRELNAQLTDLDRALFP